MVLPHNNRVWIDLYDNNKIEEIREMSNALSGFWVIFLRKNIGKNENELQAFVEEVIIVMNMYDINFAKISLPYYDRLIVFTTSSKRDINRIGIILRHNLHLKAENMIWEANFESSESWSEGGWLERLQTSFNALDSLIPDELKRTKKFEYTILQRSLVYQKMLEERVMNRQSMVVCPAFGDIGYTIKEKSVFLIMPFGEIWSDDVNNTIKTICNQEGITVQRADDMFDTKRDVIGDIWKGINEAELIITDITVKNANVFYELGIAHTLGKDIVLLHQKDGERIPFDVSTRRYIEYGLYPSDYEKFKSDLRDIVRSFFVLNK